MRIVIFQITQYIKRWTNYSQFLNVHSVNDVRQIEMHTAELLVSDSSPFVFEIAIADLKMTFYLSDLKTVLFLYLTVHVYILH
jgi:hypothetical protein